MIIKETPWEKENLGVDSSVVFQFEESDFDVDPIILDNAKYKYQEATVPMGKVDIINKLIQHGFRFAEVMVDISVGTMIKMPDRMQRIQLQFSSHIANDYEKQMILDLIAHTNIFTTDKISLNPNFGLDIAAKRYYNWMTKELDNQNVYCYVMNYKCEPVGFFVIKRINEYVIDGLLSGMFDTTKYKGMGMQLGYCLISTAKELGAKKVTGKVSSNNIGVLKMNECLGYKINQMNYVMSKLV